MAAATPGFPNDIDPALPTRLEGSPRGNTKRRQTLLTLLNALHELSKDDGMGGLEPEQQPSFEDDRDVPSVDEHLQKVGAESFNRFQRRVNNLDKELRNFSNAARQLGSSVGILSSAFHLRDRITQVAYLFRENAADLFPRKVSHQPKESLARPDVLPRKLRHKHKPPPHVRRPVVLDGLDPEDFPVQLGYFARDVMTFLHCLNEFPEFTDEAVNASIVAFEGDLKYWASCLKTYEGQFKYPAVQRYLHDLISEMGEHIESISTSLSMFIEIGVPTIRFAQKHGASNLLNLSTVATFFSAVTATTLQFSYGTTGTTLSDAVNAFWFTSMVFSIAAAVNSLLGLTWKQAMYRSPGHRVPWWVLIWIKRSPLVFLVLSVACFSVGLVLFAYSSKQNYVVSTITTVFTAFSSFGLAAVSAWFASERWVFSRHKGKKWLQDSLDDFWDGFTGFYPIRVLSDLFRVIFVYSRRATMRTREVAIQASSTLSNLFSRHSSETLNGSSSENSLPRAGSPEHILTSLRTRRGSDNTHGTSPLSEPKSPTIAGSSVDFSYGTLSEKLPAGNPSSTTLSVPRARLKNAVRSVIMMQAASTPFRSRTMSSTLVSLDGTRRETLHLPMRSSRVAGLVPRLKGLTATQDLAAHQALVRHLQFSPNGKFLATSSWDRTSVIFHVGEPFTHHRTLAHPQGFVSQVAWSPNGNLLLTKLNRVVKVWTEAGVCTRTIDRHTSVQSICWLPGGEAFMSVEGGDVTKLDLTGKVLDTYHFHRLTIHDVSVTPDGQRLLGVGTLLESRDGLQPSRCRAEKQIVVYNLDRKEIENQVPVLHDIRDITLARNGHFALVSYEFKAPPQLWKLETVKDRTKADTTTIRLSLRHTYLPKFPVDFAGPSYFGGKDDQLVLCAGKAGDIHIWDRESGSLLHHVRAQALGGDLTCIAWNPAADPFMFATGSHDGAVRIWTTPPAGEDTQYAGPSYTGTPGTSTPRTTSSTPVLDLEYRAESPTTQQEFEHGALSRQSESTDDHGAPAPSRRTISFTTSQPLGSVLPAPPM
ncbi:WD40 repeat-like protein [Auriscalpium vulgare]|uniref:WD40 repeat-like protein n=1 Tax=Auriscalpium vulgare TaxID=40419 RepID=A0ACB8RZ92_9AGAM|nr:WD40 repeat-like protein [Auriscalpium vulgare]